ncbi:MAG: ATP-binding protein [Kiritimatiellae bacterium]|nr:ATP-binding protein [Kiritimatiellia bacterium]
MKRNFTERLETWAANADRKPLVMRGMRQTGKTWCVRELAARRFAGRFCEVDFEYSKAWRQVFEADLDPVRICRELEMLAGTSIVPGETLLFFDEVQACPRALESLRYFREKMPGLHVVAAGSLLDFALEEHPFPVGRVQFAELAPMGFAEFLEACGEEVLAEAVRGAPAALPEAVHGRLLERVKEYCLAGGLPECVRIWAETRRYRPVRETQEALVSAFEQDFGKYPERMDADTLEAVWRNANASVGRQVSWAGLSREHAGATNKKAFSLLCKARLLHACRAVAGAAFPFESDATPRIKPYAGDVGLFQARSGMPVDPQILAGDILSVYQGALAEQFVAQEFAAARGREALHWWKREAHNSTAEVDFVVEAGGRVVPVEVKAGAAGRLRSLHQFLADHPNVKEGVVLSSAPYGTLPEQRLRFVPLYFAGSFAAAQAN